MRRSVEWTLRAWDHSSGTEDTSTLGSGDSFSSLDVPSRSLSSSGDTS